MISLEISIGGTFGQAGTHGSVGVIYDTENGHFGLGGTIKGGLGAGLNSGVSPEIDVSSGSLATGISDFRSIYGEFPGFGGTLESGDDGTISGGPIGFGGEDILPGTGVGYDVGRTWTIDMTGECNKLEQRLDNAIRDHCGAPR